MGGTKVKKTNVSVHTKAHIAILLTPVLEGGCHYAAKGLALERISAHAFSSALAAIVVLRDAGLDEAQNVTVAAGEG